jgi:REP element-mobilizing transposase RayT
MKTTGKGHNSDSWIFNNKNKREFQHQLNRFLNLFDPIQLIGFTIMSNHVHMILNIPVEYSISRDEVARKYRECYPNRQIHPNSSMCQKLQKQLNNISCFMQRFSREFAYHFNKNRKFKRTGHLWGERFHNTNLGDDYALLRCWVYMMFNPVKAKMVHNPLAYKFSSISCESSDFSQEVLSNFYKLYKYLSGKDNLTLEAFRSMVIAILQTELDK